MDATASALMGVSVVEHVYHPGRSLKDPFTLTRFSHPGIFMIECAEDRLAWFIGEPDERLGEDVAAAIVLRRGVALTTTELQIFLAETIAKHKIPSTVIFLDEALPRNASGKFLKRDLRALVLSSR